MRKHEMVYCFAKKCPAYDTSSHLTGEIIEKPANKNDKVIEMLTGGKVCFDKPHKCKVISNPLPTSDITPPSEEHELVYCFAKKCPAYDTSSHKDFKVGNTKTTDKIDLYGTNDKIKGNTHKERLPTSDITQPSEEHELVYCFAKKCPEYDVSSHKDFTVDIREGKDLKQGKDCYGLEGKDCINKKRHKDPLPTSDITPPSEEHELVYCFAKKCPVYDTSSHKDLDEVGFEYDKKLKGAYGDNPVFMKGNTHKERLPTSDITQEEDSPSSWCHYPLDEKIDHRTAKPVKLMEFLLKYWTKEGDVVLDPTAGSGSMGVACKNMNRNFVGIEKDDKIFELMKTRLI